MATLEQTPEGLEARDELPRADKRNDARARQAIARADRVAATLARHHISVSTAEPFAVTAHIPQAIRLALGSADLSGLSATLRTVAHVISLDAAQSLVTGYCRPHRDLARGHARS